MGGGGGRGRKIAAGSMAVAILGAVARDLSRPNSVIRGLVSVIRKKLEARRESRLKVDISDIVEDSIGDNNAPGFSADENEINQQEV